MRPIQLTARDGLALHGYLTTAQRPGGQEAADGGHAAWRTVRYPGRLGVRRRSAVARAARAMPCCRSTSAVRAVTAGLRVRPARSEWGGKMQDDLTDATRWAVAQGIADPKRICIYGGSYGGYASLMGVGQGAALCTSARWAMSASTTCRRMQTDGEAQRRWLRKRPGCNDWVGKPRNAGGGFAEPPRRPDQGAGVPCRGRRGRARSHRAQRDDGEGAEQVPAFRWKRCTTRPKATASTPTSTAGEYYTRLLGFLTRNIGG